jgi:tetratricopeptide (TPR) repeat protein
VIYQHQGEQERAIATLEDAQSRLRQLGSNERLSFSLVCLGSLKQLTGDLDAATAHYEESLELSRVRDDRSAMLSALINLGEVAQLRGKTDDARKSLQESLGVAHQLGHRMAIAYCLEVLAALHFEQPALAGRMFGAAEKIREDINAPVESWNRQRYEKDVSVLRELLSDDSLTAAWESGRNGRLDDVLLELG